MHRIETTIATAHASKYLQQLCKHWSHKFDVAFSPTQGRVPFGEGRVCDMQADDAGLTLRLEANDAAEAERMGGVVIDHLARFAHREQLPAAVWRTV